MKKVKYNNWIKILSILFFILLFGSYAQIFAVFSPGQTLNPNCAPGATGCIVESIPSQLGNANKYLTTDGTNMSWSSTPVGVTASSSEVFTNKDLTSITNTFPTFNQNTTGTSAGLSSAYIDWNAVSGGSSILNKPSIPSTLASLADDITHRLVTDTEKGVWNGKQNSLGFTPYNSTNPAGYITDGNTGWDNSYGFLTSYTETDPTIYAWAKSSAKPTYTASEVGLGNVPNLSFSGSNTGDETTLSIQTKLGTASTSTSGYLTSTDWNIFNNKISMVYPASGIPNSTGSSWGTSYTTNGSGTVLALATTPTFTTNITTPLVLGGSTTTSPLTFQTTSGVGTTGADMHFKVGNAGGTEAMTILNNGNVGINNNNPQSQLQINTSSNTNKGLIIKASSGQSANLIELQDSTGGYMAGFDFQGNFGTTSVFYDAASNYFALGGYNLQFANNGLMNWSSTTNYGGTKDIGLSRGAAGKLYVGNGAASDYSGTLIAGNVGIGTTSPNYKLDVQGKASIGYPLAGGSDQLTVGGASTVGATIITSSNTGGQAYVNLSGGANITDGVIGTWGFTNYDSSWVASQVAKVEAKRGSGGAAEGYLSFSTKTQAGTIGERMRINPSGNVGIGSTSPLRALEVNGSARITGKTNTTLSGTGASTIGGSTLTGSGTSFTTDLIIGDTILFNGDVRTIISIASDTSLVVDQNFSATVSGLSISKYPSIFTLRNSSNVEKLVVNNTGLIGMGAVNPTTILDVRGPNLPVGTPFYGAAKSQLFVGSTDALGADIGGSIGLGGLYDSTSAFPMAFATIHGKKETSGSGATGGYLAFETSNNSTSPYNFERMRINSIGNVGIGITSPTAVLHLKAGTATANTAPLKFTSGALLSTPEAGSVEFLNDAYYGTITTGAARKQFAFTDSTLSKTGNPIISPVTLGSELLTNPSFATDLSSWTAGAGWAWNTGSAKHTSGNTATLTQTISVTSGKTYQVVVTIAGATTSGIQFQLGSLNYLHDTTLSGVTNGTESKSFLATSTGSITFTITPLTNFDGSITDVSIKEAVLPSLDTPSTSGDLIIGLNSGLNRISSLGNTVLGEYAAQSLTNGYQNTAMGYKSMQSVTNGYSNVAIGYLAQPAMTTGSRNVAMGVYSQLKLTTGTFNTAIGTHAQQELTTGSNNTAVGASSMMFNAVTGTSNSAVGNASLYQLSSGNNNVAEGASALYNITNSSDNTGIGMNALNQLTTGGQNVAVGSQSGMDFGVAMNTISSSVFVGYQARPGSNSLTNMIAIGANTVATKSNQVVLGNSSIVETLLNGNVGIGATSPTYSLQVGNNTVSGIVSRFQNSTGTCDINPTTSSLACSSDINLKKNILTMDNKEFILQTIPDIKNKTTLEKISYLTPVNYNWKSESDTASKHVGFIAQEMEQIFPDLVMTDSETGLKSISYASITPYLVSAIQEMNLNIKDLSSLDTSSATSLGSLVKNFLGNIGNSIDIVFFGEVHTKKLCLDDLCITKDELKQILDHVSVSNATPPAASSTDSAPSTSQPSATPDEQPATPDAPVTSPAASSTDSAPSTSQSSATPDEQPATPDAPVTPAPSV